MKYVAEYFPDHNDDMSITKLYREGPADAFYMVKLWANLENLSSTFPDSKLNPVGIVKNFEAGPENHSNHSPIQITTKLWFWDRPILQKTEVSSRSIVHEIFSFSTFWCF